MEGWRDGEGWQVGMEGWEMAMDEEVGLGWEWAL